MPINVVHVGQDHLVDYTPTSDVTAGTVVVLNDLLGVALSPLQANRPGSLLVRGLVEAPKAPEAINVGQVVYWDATNGRVTVTAGSNKRAGLAAETKAAAATRIQVLWGR